ncbi:MAG: DMT family transporter [Candidatus Thalassarchaeum sp.]|nr:DMT family transporter [Candidatus Thalassarchaeum sp.]
MSETQSGTPASAWALLGVALLAVSSAGVVLQQMGDVPPLLRASWRMQGTALVLLPGFVYQFWLNERPRVEREDILVLVASSAFLAIHFGSWVWSLDNTSLVHSLLFVNTHPLVLVALMPLMGRAVSRGHVMGVLIGFVGAAVTLLEIGGEGPVTPEGDAAAFLGAATVVGYLLAGRHLRSERGMPIFVYAFPVTLGAGIWLSISSFALESTALSSIPPESSLMGWTDLFWLPWVAYLSFGPGLCGHTGINTVLRWISPIIVSIVLLMEPVIGGLIGWILTDESFIGPFTIVGGSLMIAGAIMVTLEENEEHHG